jgi:UDP-2,3-diacylglucosamine hydrolase
MERIAILAGGGRLPLVLADSIANRGGHAHIVGVRGEAGPEIEAYPHTWVTWGSVNAILTTLKRESNGTMMIAGTVSRPDLKRLKPDFGVIRYLPDVLTMLKGGDDAVLTRLVRFFEKQGLTVKGVGDVAPELLAEAGMAHGVAEHARESGVAEHARESGVAEHARESGVAEHARESGVAEHARESGVHVGDADMTLGFAVLDAVADLDIGQAIAVENGAILAIEGAEGTDRMLARIAMLPGRDVAGGVVVKGPKRGQDLRVDMPTVGAETVKRLADARIGTLVVVAGKTLLLNRADMLQQVEARHIVLRSVERDIAATEVSNTRLRRAALLVTRSATMLGRFSPNHADARDARTAVEVTQRLAAFATGRAAVVVRDHVLAVAAAEGPVAMAVRVAALRQWGHKRRGRGAAAFLFDPSRDDANELTSMIGALAGAGLAGVALVRAPILGNDPGIIPVTQIPMSAVAAADQLRLFLIEIDVDPSRSAIEAA